MIIQLRHVKTHNNTKMKEKWDMKKDLTELVFILDRSGSMSGLEADTIGGFNSMIEKQKKEKGEAVVTTVLFDNQIETIHDRAELKTITPMTDKEYFVRGMTALLDAVGSTIQHIDHVHKVIGDDNIPEHTVFVITTDGLENASKEYSAEKVKKMIEEKQEKDHWEFLFLGANIDAIKTAGHLGIHANRAVNYHSDSVGTQLNYEVMSDTIGAFRRREAVGDEWKKRIDDDYNKRK